MKKKTLKLDREAIQVLQPEELASAGGGTINRPTFLPCTHSCQCTHTCTTVTSQ